MTRHTLCVALAVYAAVSPVRAAPLALMVNDAGDAGNGSCAIVCTLRDAIANVADGGTISFAPGILPATITLQQGELAISKNVSILGPGAGVLAISGGGTGRVLFLPGPGNVTIADVTLRDGAVTGANGTPGVSGSPGGAGDDALGGCIYVGSQLSLQRASIRNCTAKGGDGGAGAPGYSGGAGGYANGGAIYVAIDLLLNETSIIDAHAAAGNGGAGGDATFIAGKGGSGGSANGGAIWLATAADLFVRNATIASGVATAGNGGDGGNSPISGAGGFGGYGGNATGGLVGGEFSLGIFDFSTLAQGSVAAGSGGAGGTNSSSGAAGLPGVAYGAALFFGQSSGDFGATSIVGSSGASSCYSSVKPRAGSSNLADDASCDADLFGSLATTFRPLQENAALPHYMPVYGSVVIDAASGCADHYGAPVPTDEQSVPRPQGPACDIGAIEADYVFVAEFD